MAASGRSILFVGTKKQAQEVMSQSSFYSSNDPRLHFGLGPETTADIEIRWPSGLQEKLKGISADQLLVVKEGAGILPAVDWPKK